MILPITNITFKDSQKLRRKPLGTNGMSITITTREIKEMQNHLSGLYVGEVKATFAEKICRANKVY